MTTLLLSIVLVGIVTAGFAIRLFFVKDGEVRGGCASQNPLLANEIGECGLCGSKVGEACRGDRKKLNEFPKIGN